MKQSIVKKELRTKKGVVFNAGESVEIESVKEHSGFIRATTRDGRSIITRATSANEKFKGIQKQPSMKTLENWVFDVSTPKALDGCRVDPDGYCVHGMPSWMLALGMI